MDASNTEIDNTLPVDPSRRNFVAKVGVGAGIVWVAPQIFTSAAGADIGGASPGNFDAPPPDKAGQLSTTQFGLATCDDIGSGNSAGRCLVAGYTGDPPRILQPNPNVTPIGKTWIQATGLSSVPVAGHPTGCNPGQSLPMVDHEARGITMATNGSYGWVGSNGLINLYITTDPLNPSLVTPAFRTHDTGSTTLTGIATNNLGTWVAVGVLSGGTVAVSCDNGITWSQFSLSPIDAGINEVHFANGAWVIVGYGGAGQKAGIWTSTTACPTAPGDWTRVGNASITLQGAKLITTMYDLTYSAACGKWFAVGDQGTLLVSSNNGASWADSGTGKSGGIIRGVSVNELTGTIAIAGDPSVGIRTANCNTLNFAQCLSQIATFYDIEWTGNGDEWLVVGDGDKLYYSTDDGDFWWDTNTPSPLGAIYYSIGCAVVTSSSGAGCDAPSTPNLSNCLTVGSTQGIGERLEYFSGTCWRQIPNFQDFVPGDDESLYATAIGPNNSFVYAGNFGRIAVYDGAAGVWRHHDDGGTVWHHADFGGPTGGCIVLTEGGGTGRRIGVSQDMGASWFFYDMPHATGSAVSTVNEVKYANGVWIAVGYSANLKGEAIWRSTVGCPIQASHWTVTQDVNSSGVSGNLVTLNGVTYASGNTWYACGNFGEIFRSTDNGATWSLYNSTNIVAIWQGIAVNPTTGSIVVAGDYGLWTQAKGIGNFERENGSGPNIGAISTFQDVVFDPTANAFVAVGEVGQIYHSVADGRGWTAVNQPRAATYWDVDCAAGFNPSGTTSVRRTQLQILADAGGFGGSGKPCISVAGVDDVYIKPNGEYATFTSGVVRFYDAAGTLIRTTADMGGHNRIAGGPGGSWVAIEAGDYADAGTQRWEIRSTTDNWATITNSNILASGAGTGTIRDVGYAGGGTNKFFIVGGVWTIAGSNGIMTAPGATPSSWTKTGQDPAGIQYAAEGCNGVMWATGSSGAIVRSTNGGSSWGTWATVGADVLTDIGVNPTTGTVIVTNSNGTAGVAGTRLFLNGSTSSTWINQLPGVTDEIEWSGGNNWIARDGSTWYVSQDDGQNWSVISTGDPGVADIPAGRFDCACD